MVHCGKDTQSESAEDPLYALSHNLPLNLKVIVNNKLIPEMRRLFSHFLAANLSSESAAYLLSTGAYNPSAYSLAFLSDGPHFRSAVHCYGLIGYC